jgi:uncharacterized membrane protein
MARFALVHSDSGDVSYNLGCALCVLLRYATDFDFYYPFYRPFFFPFGLLFGIFLIFIIFGALRWVFWPWGWGYRRSHWRYRDESYYIVRQRYARGEITKEQFQQMMRYLQEANSKT